MFPPPVCPDENFRRQLYGKWMGYLARGVTAALLLPFEILDYLFRGRRVGRRPFVRWTLSATVLVSGAAIWALCWPAPFPADTRTGPILACILALLATATLNGRLQAREAAGLPALNWQPKQRAIFVAFHGHGPQGRGHHAHGGCGHGLFPHPCGKWGRGKGGWPALAPAPGSGSGVPASGGSASPDPAPRSTGVCIGNCRECTEEICVRSGRPKPRRTA